MIVLDSKTTRVSKTQHRNEGGGGRQKRQAGDPTFAKFIITPTAVRRCMDQNGFKTVLDSSTSRTFPSSCESDLLGEIHTKFIFESE